jgi:hypothetical protein
VRPHGCNLIQLLRANCLYPEADLRDCPPEDHKYPPENSGNHPTTDRVYPHACRSLSTNFGLHLLMNPSGYLPPDTCDLHPTESQLESPNASGFEYERKKNMKIKWHLQEQLLSSQSTEDDLQSTSMLFVPVEPVSLYPHRPKGLSLLDIRGKGPHHRFLCLLHHLLYLFKLSV